jgi:threonine aldolase
MRRAMAEAEVGDDIVKEDPTVNLLEQRVAELTRKEAALYVPSGHMGNQLCLRACSQPGDALIAHVGSHVLHYETGTPCAVSGLTPRVIDTPDGTFTPEQVEVHILPRNIHHARARILSLENTHNRCGGTVWDLEQFRAVCACGHKQGLHVHLDGARIWNACAASGTQPQDWTGYADSINVCFSKGLGAPVGSALAGTEKFVEECRFYRKMFGGQMRQAGIIAAGALYGLEHNLDRLVEDHRNAKLLAQQVDSVPGLKCMRPQSNIVMVDILAEGVTAQQLVDAVAQDVLLYPVGPRRVRVVTHLDVGKKEMMQAGEGFRRAMQRLAPA